MTLLRAGMLSVLLLLAVTLAWLWGPRSSDPALQQAAFTQPSLPPAYAELEQALESGDAAALDALEEDNEYLTEGDVFTEDLVQTWLDYKRTKEIDPQRFRPTPHEFELYYDC